MVLYENYLVFMVLDRLPQKAALHPFVEKWVSLFLYMSDHEIHNILAIGIFPNQKKH